MQVLLVIFKAFFSFLIGIFNGVHGNVFLRLLSYKTLIENILSLNHQEPYDLNHKSYEPKKKSCFFKNIFHLVFHCFDLFTSLQNVFCSSSVSFIDNIYLYITLKNTVAGE